MPRNSTVSVPEKDIRRFLAKVEVTDDHWWWQGWVERNGYGRFSYQGKQIGAHVMACHIFYGMPIYRPRTESVDHLCRELLCVRPSHLLPGSQHENMMRAPRYATEYCKRGHEYTAENTYWYTQRDGVTRRECRECARIRRAGYAS
jgi:HNH endonuclease